MNIAYNVDCLEYMKSLKDNEFDLIIADPPYGDCDGSWGGYEIRTAVQEIQKPSGRLHNHGRFARYQGGGKMQNVASDFQAELGQQSIKNQLGGVWTDKTAYFGMLRLPRKSLKRCLECPRIKSFGVVITLIYHQLDALLCGTSYQFPPSFQWLCASTHGLALRVRTPSAGKERLKEQRQTHASIQHRSQLAFTSFCYNSSHPRATEF